MLFRRPRHSAIGLLSLDQLYNGYFSSFRILVNDLVRLDLQQVLFRRPRSRDWLTIPELKEPFSTSVLNTDHEYVQLGGGECTGNLTHRCKHHGWSVGDKKLTRPSERTKTGSYDNLIFMDYHDAGFTPHFCEPSQNNKQL